MLGLSELQGKKRLTTTDIGYLVENIMYDHIGQWPLYLLA
jgi:hypothetical protein